MGECVILTLTPELPKHGVPRPRAARHNIICNSFFLISKLIFQLYGNKTTCKPVFRPYVYLPKKGKPVFRPYKVRGLKTLLCWSIHSFIFFI